MQINHMAITAYVVIGTRYEEKDLVRAFGQKYKSYQASKPMLIPFTKGFSNKKNGGVLKEELV